MPYPCSAPNGNLRLGRTRIETHTGGWQMDKRKLRKKILIDKNLQLRLARRLFGYWATMWLLVFVLPFLTTLIYRWFFMSVPFAELLGHMVEEFWFPILISLLLLPIAVRDSIRFSHKFAGPFFRLHREMRNLADGNLAEEVRPRDGDFCHEFAADFNRVLRKMNAIKQANRN